MSTPSGSLLSASREPFVPGVTPFGLFVLVPLGVPGAFPVDVPPADEPLADELPAPGEPVPLAPLLPFDPASLLPLFRPFAPLFEPVPDGLVTLPVPLCGVRPGASDEPVEPLPLFVDGSYPGPV